MPNAATPILNNSLRLAALRRLCLLNTPADPAFDRLTRLASYVLQAPMSLVTLVEAEYQFFKSHVGLPEPWATTRQTPLTHSFCQHTLALAEPLIINDSTKHPLVSDNLAIQDLNAIAYAGIPLITSDGEALGSFCVMDTKPRDWTPNEIGLLKDLSVSVITEIELRHQLIEKAEIEAELRVAIDKQKELAQLKSRFVWMISHEFRTPLAIIHSSGDLLSQYHQHLTQERQQEHIAKIKDQTHILNKLLDDILAIGKAETLELDFHPRMVDLVSLTQRIAQEVQDISPHHSIQLSATGHDTHAIFDPSLIAQAISNLLTNAVKYSPHDSVIQFDLILEPETIVISVRDAGQGISEDDQQHLFEAFYRAENVRAVTGTGLGLTIVKRAVDAHGGTITCDSALDKGTTFVIRLPRYSNPSLLSN